MAELHLIIILVYITACTSSSNASQNTSIYFRRAPKSVTVLVDSAVKFECQAAWAASSVRWTINNRAWGLLDTPSASMSSNRDPSWNSSIFSRHISKVHRDYNNSRVQCVLTLEVGGQRYSDEALLIIRDSPFWQTPQSINTTLGSVIEFLCSSSLSDRSVSWYHFINNTSQLLSNSTDVVISTNTLQMTAHQQLNNSDVQCILEPEQTESDLATISIQGLLAPVGDLHVTVSDINFVLISWTAPFSLDITDSDPDTWYTVSIYTHTESHVSMLPCNDCHNITQTFYNFTITGNMSGMYQFDVVPVNALGDGSESTRVAIYIMMKKNRQHDHISQCPSLNNTTIDSTSADEQIRGSLAATTVSCTSSMLPGIGIGVPLGAVLAVAAIGILLMRSCYRGHIRQRNCVPKEILQHNPAYESCSPRQDVPTYEICNNIYKSSQDMRNTPPSTGFSQERDYEEIKI